MSEQQPYTWTFKPLSALRNLQRHCSSRIHPYKISVNRGSLLPCLPKPQAISNKLPKKHDVLSLLQHPANLQLCRSLPNCQLSISEQNNFSVGETGTCSYSARVPQPLLGHSAEHSTSLKLIACFSGQEVLQRHVVQSGNYFGRVTSFVAVHCLQRALKPS